MEETFDTVESSAEIEELTSPAEAPSQPDDALFHVEADWEDHWRGMPEYSHENLQPWQTVLVHFQTEADRAAFARLVGQTLHAKTKFIWYPKAEIRKASDKVYTSEKVTPRYPIYIISKGRWDSRLTSKALEWIQVPYHIVIEPQEYDHYAAVIDKKKILTLPFSNLGLGGIPARNWVWEHAISVGAERHWILDDNISGFCRFHDNLKVEVDSGATFCAVEDWVDRYENVVMAGFNYDYFAPRKQGSKIRPITLNTRVYSGILLRNDLVDVDGNPIRWRGRYNEDTDLSLRILKDGWKVDGGGRYATALFNALLMYKKPTLTMKGGNTDELYRGVEAVATEWEAHTASCGDCAACVDGYDSRRTPCETGRQILSKDGRWLMAESLREQHPDVTTVERKWRRWQHQVDYRRFKNNPLILRPDAVISAGTNDYGMSLGAMPGDVGGHDARASAMGAATRVPQPVTTSAPQATATEPRVSALAFALGLAEPAEQLEPEQLAAIQRAEPSGLVEAPAAPETPALGQPDEPDGLPRRPSVLAEFLGSVSVAEPLRPARPSYTWQLQEPPSLDGVDEIALNFETTGLDWLGDDEPIGVTIMSLDGQLRRFLPWGFTGGNLDKAIVVRFLQHEVRDKYILNANTRFEIHMGRKVGVDFEAQGCRVGDVMHHAALVDDRRRRFALDVLVKDLLNDEGPPRVDESRMATYHASEVAERAEFQVEAVARLRDELWPLMTAQQLHDVRQLEDEVIYPVVEMEKNGSPIDEELLERCYAECTAAHDQLMMEVAQEVGFGFDHTTKGWKRLFEHLNLPPTDSYAESVIETIDHPTVKKAYRASQYASLNSKSFAAYKKQIRNGVLYYDINQLRGDDGGTVSGRFSIGYVQQVPNHDNHHAVFGTGDEKTCGGLCPLFPRRVYRPLVGDYLEADAAQIEYRLFAHFASNSEVLRAYQEDPRMSFHKKMWAMLQQYKPDMLYTHTKSFDFAKQYGAKSIKLATMMKFITEKEGNEIRAAKRWNDPRLNQIHEIEAAFKRAMPEGDALLERASHLAKPFCDEYCKKGDRLHRDYPHRGYVKTIMGRRSRFEDNYKTYIGLNRVLQGSGADIMKRKLVELHKARRDTGFTLRLTNHDAVGGDATTPETRAKVDEILNHQSFPQLKVQILWELKSGANWAECK